MRIFGWTILILIVVSIFGFAFRACGTANRMVNNGLKTVENEFKPSELLRKYEWFKDASAQLDAKLANLDVYESRFKSLNQAYGEDSLRRSVWAREDRSQWAIWQSECAGVAASYNSLAAEYNSQMAKFNWRFCNVGTMPQGAEYDKVLPREYKAYIYN